MIVWSVRLREEFRIGKYWDISFLRQPTHYPFSSPFPHPFPISLPLPDPSHAFKDWISILKELEQDGPNKPSLELEKVFKNYFKGTVHLISSNPPFQELHAGSTPAPFNPVFEFNNTNDDVIFLFKRTVAASIVTFLANMAISDLQRTS